MNGRMPAGGTTGGEGARTIPIPLRDEPLALWYRFGVLDNRKASPGEPVAEKRVLKDFCLHLLIKGSSWIWCEAAGGSVAVDAGDLLFIPPGFVHAWAYTGETHLAIHFDLQRNPALTPNNYDHAFAMIDFLGGAVEPAPAADMPVFSLRFPWQDEGEGWRIPLVTRVDSWALWRRRLGELVQRWDNRMLETVPSQLRSAGTLAWALEALTLRGNRNPHLVGVPDIANLLDRLRDPHVLAELASMSVPSLAHSLGMGETRFRILFKSMTARSPHRYFRERQVRLAADMLRDTTQTTKAIATMVGFDDPYHFSRIFRELTGKSPTAYRRETRGRTGPLVAGTLPRGRGAGGAAVKQVG